MTPPESSGVGEVEEAPVAVNLEVVEQENKDEGWTKVEKRKGKKHKKTEGKQDVCVACYMFCAVYFANVWCCME